MFMSAETMRLLMESGLPNDKIIEIYASLERDFRAVNGAPKVPTKAELAAERRREKDRIRKADLRKSAENPRNSADTKSAEKCGKSAESPQMSAPLARVEDNLLSLVTTGEGSTNANAFVGDVGKIPRKSAPRGTRLPEDWEPSAEDWETARDHGLTDKEIDNAATEFRNFWCARAGREATKIDWGRVWANRCIQVAERKRERSARLAAQAPSFGNGQASSSFADIALKRRRLAGDDRP